MIDVQPLSQKMSSLGGTQSELLSNVVSSSDHLSKWAVFARETIQNSNDQRIEGLKSISFGLHANDIFGEALETLRKWVNSSGPHSAGNKIRISEDAKSLPVLIVSDSGTKGLSGLTDPETVSTSSNFCNFFFFTGQLQTQKTGGGSFGVGRNVLFMASRIKTIFVYSRFLEDGQEKSRFMGMATDSGFHHEGINYTGKHWWGMRSPDGESIKPLEGTEADNAALLFGLDKYLDLGTGTAIMVIEPDFSSREQDMKLLRDSLLINAWPHFLESDGAPSIKASVTDSGEVLPITDPLSAESPVIRFARAYNDQNQNGSANHKFKEFTFQGDIANLKQFGVESKNLGTLTWSQQLLDEAKPIDDVFLECGLGASNSSIALIRGAKLIVKYLPVDVANAGFTVQGVFVASDEYDTVFRKSENVTHDDWIHTRLGLPPKSKNPVLQTINGITNQFKSLTAGAPGKQTHSSVAVEISNIIGTFSNGIHIYGGGFESTEGGGSGSRSKTSKPKIQDYGRPVLASRNAGWAEGHFLFKITSLGEPANLKKYGFSPTLGIWVGSGLEEKPPLQSESASIVSIQVKDREDNPHWTTCNTSILPFENLAIGGIIKVTAAFPDEAQIACDGKIVELD